MASYGKVTRTGVLWSLLSRGLNEVIAIPTSMVLARVLTPHDFGIAAATAFFVQMATRMTNFGFNTALVQLKAVNHSHTSTIFLVNLSTGVVAWSGLTLAAKPLGELFGSAEATATLPVAAFAFLIGPLGSVPSALLIRDLRYREAMMLDTVGATVAAVVSIALALTGYGFWSLIYGQLTSIAVATAARIAVTKWSPQLSFSWDALKQLLSFGIGIHTKRILDTAALSIDNLVVGRSLGLNALGLYDRAFSTMNRVTTALGSAAPAVSFRVLALIADDPSRFRSAYRKISLVSTMIIYPSLTFLIVLAPEIFLVMFGPQWTAATQPFQILCVAGALKSINALASTASQSRGFVWGEVSRQIAYLTTIVAAVGIGSLWGLSGAAIGVLLATIMMTAAMHHYLLKTTSVSWSDLFASQLPAVTFSSGLGLVLVGVRFAAQSLTPLALIGLAVFVSTVLFVGFLRWNPSAELRDVAHETTVELMPRLSGLLGRGTDRTPAAQAAADR